MKPGARGEYPHGKLDPSDEGALNCAISNDAHGNVRIDFGKPVAWLVMPKEQAFQFARTIMQRSVDLVIIEGKE